MLHSALEDAHKGRRFKIRFYSHPNGFTADLAIEGLPLITDDDNLWRDREDAKAAMVNEARRIIEQ